ncbi:MAG: gamma-glutamylcyclotransferase family protein [Candidatus Altiarchaeota archaeon]
MSFSIFGRKAQNQEEKVSCDRIFVYGTLMNLYAVRDIWSVEPLKIEKATMRGDLYSAESQPIMMEGKGKVHGLVLTIPDLAADPGIFDKYEACRNNHPESFHLRILRDAKLDDDGTVKAWAYLGNPKHRRVAKTCVEQNLIREGKWTTQPNWLHGPLE